MARLNVVEPGNAEGKAAELFEGPLKGKHFNLFKGMINSPAVIEAYLGYAGALQSASLSTAEQEVVQLTIAEANDCDYCKAAHTAIGKGAGLSETQTVEARSGSLDDPRLAALSTFARALHEKRGFVSDDDLEAFRGAGFGDGEIAEVVAVYALATLTNFFNHVNETEIDFPAPPAVQVA